MGPAVAFAARADGTLGRDWAWLRQKQRAENFPVALRLLPRAARHRLEEIYALARLIDDVGDDPTRTPAQRTTALDEIEASLRAGAAGADDVAPFLDLVAANKQDQIVRRYRTYDDLVAYCALSANPVGRLVLSAFGVDDPALHAWSDDVCTALQILEHCQDVAEDKRDNDRIYLPLDDLVRFGVSEADLDAATATAPVRALVSFEVRRATDLLQSGRPLVRRLRGVTRIAIAGYVAGGLATADALRAADCDVLTMAPRPRRAVRARHFARLVVAR